MRAAVIQFPGSNCDRDMAVALRAAGADVTIVWHKNTDLPDGLDFVAIPGGFSFGDYLRVGAIAARSPICQSTASSVTQTTRYKKWSKRLSTSADDRFHTGSN